MAQLTVGLDLGSQSIKRVRLQSSFRTVEVVDFDHLPVPDDERPRLERLGEALQQLGYDHSSDLVATALPGDEVSVRLLTLPFTDRKKISQTIGFELEGQIPFSLDQTVFDYLTAGSSSKGDSHQLVALCQTDRMRQWLELFESTGLDPRLIGPDSLAYTSLVDLLPSRDELSTCAFVDIGHRLTALCIVGPTGLEYARTLSVGGAQVTAKLAEVFQVNLPTAEEGKRRAGFVETKEHTASGSEQASISKAVGQAISPLERELTQSLSAHRSMFGQSVSKIWLCGGASGISNLDGYLASRLEIEVERIRTDHVNLPGMQNLSETAADSNAWVKSLGLALHAHQGGRHGWLNLRQGSFAFKGDFQYFRGRLLHVGVALLILLFLAIGHAVTRHFSLSSIERSLDQQIGNVIQAILKKSYKDPETAISIMKENMAPEADLLPRVTALDVLRAIHERLSEDFKLTLKDIHINPKKVRLTGLTDSFESVEKIRSALEGYECFTEIQTGRVQKTPDGTQVEFPFTIVVGC